MTKAFLDDKDIHSITASKLFNVPFESVTREMRSMLKLSILELFMEFLLLA